MQKIQARLAIQVSYFSLRVLVPSGLIAGALFTFVTAQAAPNAGKQRATLLAQDSLVTSESYARALLQLEKRGPRPVDGLTFRSFDWQGRTAALNFVCSKNQAVACRDILKLGLADRALVVRDHALRIVQKSALYSPEEKQNIARAVTADKRNYRQGRPLFIVGHAEKTLKE